MKDLILLVADKSMEYSLRAGLLRHQSLGIRRISFDVLQHPQRDGGARTDGVKMLALERKSYEHALLVFDYEGCGDSRSSEKIHEIEQEQNEQLGRLWGDNAKCIIIYPELDIWMWGSNNLLSEIFEWNESVSIRDWLQEKDYRFDHQGKPERPKEALEELFPFCGKPRSSANYSKIVERISFSKCNDMSFVKLRNYLQSWFPE